MKTIKLLPLLLALILMAACEKEQVDQAPELNNKTAETLVSKEVLNKVSKLNFNSKHVEKTKCCFPTEVLSRTIL